MPGKEKKSVGDGCDEHEGGGLGGGEKSRFAKQNPAALFLSESRG